ncbi:MAG: hypothetical protein M3552_00880 [Planctomycetota bacterium]|nr:hypothetical protein [Planctomycetaceae bacterium]MDQ3329199.1 hypothetical protein [Planctomycetota bacterium]
METSPKIVGIGRLRKAAASLRRDGDGSPMLLLGGASEVWSAMFDLDAWPTELRAKAVELQTSLFRYGPIRITVEQMVEPERWQLRRELLEFVETAEQLEHDLRSRAVDALSAQEAR